MGLSDDADALRAKVFRSDMQPHFAPSVWVAGLMAIVIAAGAYFWFGHFRSAPVAPAATVTAPAK